jgi:mono/diheme cytochrome c family protein
LLFQEKRTISKMKKRPFNQFIAATTLLMAATIFACVTGGPKSAVASPTTDLVAKGKTLTTSFTCAGCHGPDLKGKMGPSLASSGALKKYTKATFERAMNLGIDAMGKPLHPPMPTFHMAKGQADAIYAYLKTI